MFSWDRVPGLASSPTMRRRLALTLTGGVVGFALSLVSVSATLQAADLGATTIKAVAQETFKSGTRTRSTAGLRICRPEDRARHRIGQCTT